MNIYFYVIEAFLCGMIAGVFLLKHIGRQAGMETAEKLLDKHAPNWRTK